MQINNPFQMNDWELDKFLKVVFAFQLVMWGAIGLDAVGLQIPIIRQLIGFTYLTFVPGILLIRILKLHKLGNIETILYTVGLSIATLMFTGLFMSIIYPFFGISGPISEIPLIVTISVVVLVLCYVSYKMDSDFSDPDFIAIKDILSPQTLFLCLIPLLSVFGTCSVNFYKNNILLMLLFVVLAILVLLIAFDKFVPEKLYPLAVFVIAISLLYHTSLISMYLTGYDIHIEYYFSNLVVTNALWDLTIPSNVNAMLSIVILAPIYSIISNMNLTWVFKIIYPLLFSLVPLGLYRVFQRQTDDKIAFLSCFFFMSIFTFYTEMLSLARQQISELFLVLLVLLMINKNMDTMKRSFLFIVFGISLAVSHYGLSYIYMFSLISVWLLLTLGKHPEIRKLVDNFYSKFDRKREWHGGNSVSLELCRTIGTNFVFLFITFTVAWYMYVSSSSTLNSIVDIGNHIASSIFTEVLSSETTEGIDIILKETTSPMREITKYLHFITQFFIVIGVLTLLLKRSGMEFEREYGVFSLVFFAICFAGIIVPHFGSSLRTARLYQITLTFLAPFCVIGGITFFRILYKVIKVSWTDQHVRLSLNALSAFLAIFLLFNSGWVYEIMNDHPKSIALSQRSVREYGDVEDKVWFHCCCVPEQDIFGAWWLSKNMGEDQGVYATYFHHRVNALAGYGMMPKEGIYPLSNRTKEITQDSYVYLSYLNVIEDLVLVAGKPVHNMTEIYSLLDKENKIYSNAGSEIYR